jgi:hypothetical protein
VCVLQERSCHATTTRDGTYKNQKPKTHKPNPKTTLTREARIDNVENISVVLVVVAVAVADDLNRFRSNAQKRLTKDEDCSGDQMCTSWC